MNKVLNGLGFNKEVRFYITNTTDLVNEITSKLNTSPVVSAAVGRSASITGIMGLMLKGDESVTTIVDGDGEIGKITSVADAHGKLRATVSNPHVDLPLKENGKLDVSKAVGEGSLLVIKDLKLKEPYNGQVPLTSGEIAQDYTYYFAASEQTPTAISAGVLVDVDYSIKSAGAFVIQLLPSASEETITKLETNFSKMGELSSILIDNDLEEIVQKIFATDYEIIDETNLDYQCTCSYDKYLTALQNLNDDEKEEIKKDKIVECTCNFCLSKYEIDSTLI